MHCSALHSTLHVIGLMHGVHACTHNLIQLHILLFLHVYNIIYIYTKSCLGFCCPIASLYRLALILLCKHTSGH